jgi:hypothetical protein
VLRKRGGLVEAPDARMVGTKGEYPPSCRLPDRLSAEGNPTPPCNGAGSFHNAGKVRRSIDNPSSLALLTGVASSWLDRRGSFQSKVGGAPCSRPGHRRLICSAGVEPHDRRCVDVFAATISERVPVLTGDFERQQAP